MSCEHKSPKTLKWFGNGIMIRWCPDCGALHDTLNARDKGWQIPLAAIWAKEESVNRALASEPK